MKSLPHTLVFVLVICRAAHADPQDDIWSMAEARIIAERCPHAKVDERVMASIRERSHIDLKENPDDRAQYAFRLEDRRDQYWARTEWQMCLRGWLGYGPNGMDVRNLLIFDHPIMK